MLRSSIAWANMSPGKKVVISIHLAFFRDLIHRVSVLAGMFNRSIVQVHANISTRQLDKLSNVPRYLTSILLSEVTHDV